MYPASNTESKFVNSAQQVSGPQKQLAVGAFLVFIRFNLQSNQPLCSLNSCFHLAQEQQHCEQHFQKNMESISHLKAGISESMCQCPPVSEACSHIIRSETLLLMSLLRLDEQVWILHHFPGPPGAQSPTQNLFTDFLTVFRT